MKTLPLFIGALLLFVQTLSAQLVEVWPNGYTSTVSRQQNVGTVIPDWRIETLDTINLATNSLTIAHHVNHTTIGKLATTSSLYEDRTYYARVGGFAYVAVYGEHVTYTKTKTGEVATVTPVDVSNVPLLIWGPTWAGVKTEGDSSWRTITATSAVECKVINRGTIPMITKLACWWVPTGGENGFGTFTVMTADGETKVVYLNADYFSVFPYSVSFINFDFDYIVDEPL